GVSPATCALGTVTTQPPPHIMLHLSCAPSSVTPNQPALPPGMVKAQRPRKGFSAATADVVMSATALTKNAKRFASRMVCMDGFILRALRSGKENGGVPIA